MRLGLQSNINILCPILSNGIATFDLILSMLQEQVGHLSIHADTSSNEVFGMSFHYKNKSEESADDPFSSLRLELFCVTEENLTFIFGKGSESLTELTLERESQLFLELSLLICATMLLHAAEPLTTTEFEEQGKNLIKAFKQATHLLVAMEMPDSDTCLRQLIGIFKRTLSSLDSIGSTDMADLVKTDANTMTRTRPSLFVDNGKIHIPGFHNHVNLRLHSGVFILAETNDCPLDFLANLTVSFTPDSTAELNAPLCLNFSCLDRKSGQITRLGLVGLQDGSAILLSSIFPKVKVYSYTPEEVSAILEVISRVASLHQVLDEMQCDMRVLSETLHLTLDGAVKRSFLDDPHPREVLGLLLGSFDVHAEHCRQTIRKEEDTEESKASEGCGL